MMSVKLSHMAILNIKSSSYHSITSIINKSEAKIVIQNIDLTRKCGALQGIINYYSI